MMQHLMRWNLQDFQQHDDVSHRCAPTTSRTRLTPERNTSDAQGRVLFVDGGDVTVT